MSQSSIVAITGGGTGGHLSIAKALAQELQKRDIPAIYIGSLYGQDQMWFGNQAKSQPKDTAQNTTKSSAQDSSLEDFGAASLAMTSLDSRAKSNTPESTPTEPLQSSSPQNPLFEACYFLNTFGVVNKRGIKKLQALWAQVRALAQVRAIFAHHRVRAVISVGGFSAGPASMGAIIFRRALFIHEQNAIKGTLNALLSPFATRVFSAFATPATPYPLQLAIKEHARVRTAFKHIIFIGGSQGARAVNNLALAIAPTLLERGIAITHQCGEKELVRVREAYENLGIADAITLFGFDSNLIAHLAQADICVGRAGASSIWENAALGLPTLYIPYPYAAKNHQYHNAQYFVQQGLGALLLEQDLQESDPENLPKQILATLAPLVDRIEPISQGLLALITQNGAQVIIDEVASIREMASAAP